MTKKKMGIFVSAIMVFSMVLSPCLVVAKTNKGDMALPEIEGVYSVPGRSDLKLRVIVYHAKNSSAAKKVKPTPEEPLLICGLQDPDSTAIVDAGGWVLPENWVYRVNLESVPSSITSTEAEELIDNSYASWQEILGDTVTFSRGDDTVKNLAKMDGQNIVSWGKASPTALAVTYIWYNPTTKVAVEIDTIMNYKFSWDWSNPDSWADGEVCAYQGVYDAQDILTHEIGHTVGLGDHYTSSYVNNTMYGYGSTGETKKNTLTTGDILGVGAIYGL